MTEINDIFSIPKKSEKSRNPVNFGTAKTDFFGKTKTNSVRDNGWILDGGSSKDALRKMGFLKNAR